VNSESVRSDSTHSEIGLRNRRRGAAAHKVEFGETTYAITINQDNERRFYAELRAYQRAHYVLPLIDQIIWLLKHEPNNGIRDAFVRDMRNQCPAPPREPACPKPDDQERAYDMRYYLDEPNIAAYISSMGPELGSIKIEADKLYHSVLPYLPKSLKRIKVGGETSSQRRIDYLNVRIYNNTSNSDWSGYGYRVIHNVRSSVFNLGKPKTL